jgi:nickel transport protein
MKRALLAFCLLLLGAAPAFAHKIKLFAAAEGMVVSGYAYFSGGTRAQGADIAAHVGERQVFGGKTDDQGAFRFTATESADHRLTVDSGDGHTAGFTIKAEELGKAAEPPSPAAETAAETAAAPAAQTATDDGRLAALIEQAVARQIRPLREQLDTYQESTRLRDALGGLGFIIGLGGLAYGLDQRRKAQRT